MGLAQGSVLTVSSGCSLVVDDATITIGGEVVSAGIFDVTAGTVEMNGATDQTIPPGTFAFNKILNLVVSNNVTLGGEDSITGALSFGNANSKTFSTDGFLTIKSSAAGTARIADITNGGINTGNSITGAVKIERYVTARRAWRLLTSPVDESGSQSIHEAWQEGVNNTTLTYASNQNPVPGYGTHITKGNDFASGFDVGINNSVSLKGYNNATGAWDAVPGTNIPITDYPGYMLFVRGDRSINLRQGVNAPATPAVLRSSGEIRSNDQSSGVAAAGFTLVSNPYASAIDFNEVGKSNSINIQDNFYLWDPRITGSNGVGGFVNVSWDGSGYEVTPFPGTGISEVIPSGSAFLVRTLDGATSGTLVVKETDKSAGGENINRPVYVSGVEKLVTNLYSVNTDGTTSIVDGIRNSFAAMYSNTVDHMDAVKLGNFAESLSTERDGQLLTVERRQPVAITDTIYYRMGQMKIKAYSFELMPEGFDNGVISAFFEDNYLHTSIPVDLRTTNSISFTVTSAAGSAAADRFRIVFRASAPLPVTMSSIKALQKNDDIEVEWKVENEIGIKHYEVEVSGDGISFNSSAMITAGSSNGAYLWLDANAKEGSNYYRIKSVGVNGEVHHSSIVKVFIGKGGEQIVLNTRVITNGIITFQLLNMPKGRYGLRLLNTLGQLMYSKQITHSGGIGTESIQVNNHLTKGIYLLEFTKPNNTKITEKIIKE